MINFDATMLINTELYCIELFRCIDKLHWVCVKHRYTSSIASQETHAFKNIHITVYFTGNSVSEIQSVLCEDAEHLKRVIVVWRSLPNKWLVIVIVYAKSVNRAITNKAIVVVYIKLWLVAYKIVRTIIDLFAIYELIF